MVDLKDLEHIYVHIYIYTLHYNKSCAIRYPEFFLSLKGESGSIEINGNFAFDFCGIGIPFPRKPACIFLKFE